MIDVKASSKISKQMGIMYSLSTSDICATTSLSKQKQDPPHIPYQGQFIHDP